MAIYRVTTVTEESTEITEHGSEDEAYRSRVTPNERAGVPVLVEAGSHHTRSVHASHRPPSG